MEITMIRKSASMKMERLLAQVQAYTQCLMMKAGFHHLIFFLDQCLLLFLTEDMMINLRDLMKTSQLSKEPGLISNIGSRRHLKESAHHSNTSDSLYAV